jgi:ketosteroid isomerase-like protein
MKTNLEAVARNKAIVRSYYEGAERGDVSEFAKCLHPDFVVSTPNYSPWGGSHHGAGRFLQVILPQAAKALDFGRFGYERFTAEDDHVVVLIRVGVAGSDATMAHQIWSLRAPSKITVS